MSRCRAITQDRSRDFLRTGSHQCPYEAKLWGLCQIHANQLERLDARERRLIRKHETVIAEIRAKRKELEGPEPLENPS